MKIENFKSYEVTIHSTICFTSQRIIEEMEEIKRKAFTFEDFQEYLCELFLNLQNNTEFDFEEMSKQDQESFANEILGNYLHYLPKKLQELISWGDDEESEDF